ncbi:MAG: hydantoinase B/oxoprolinase family protein [Alphaproteobacteria bacterium]|jgi:N-methylhydantoinase B|nr:hydantoinase B/oxoprolinase family protein [Alphaproteobacteria bacterium]MDP6516395.1 hydantoinase B/oxoprolinase family protein [Alphaproteobacteria bacterium]
MNPDPGLERIRFQVMWNRLIAVVEEQAQTLIRTAFSNTVREAGDLSAGIFDLDGRMLAQAVTGTPGHVNAMAASVNHFLARYPPAEMAPGDAYITNDPWLATGHLHDFTVVTPAFRHAELVALFAATCHVVDIGGRGFGPDAQQVFEEGLLVPIMPLLRSGKINESLLEIVRANVREPLLVEGDFYSLAACNETGCKRLVEMMDEFELDGIDGLGHQILDRSRQAMLDEIAKLPFGTWRNTMRIDGYEHALDLVAAMTIGGTGIDIDFTGTAAVSDYGINVPLPYTQAYASFGVRCVVGAMVPNNAGSLAPVRVSAPRGSILNAEKPRAVAARHAIGQMLPDVVLGCLHQAVDGIAPAEGTSCLWNFVLYGGDGIAGGGENFANATPFTVTLFHNGGTGARPTKDGLSATAFPSGVRNTPVEINEAIAPIRIWRKEYRTDSGGPGRHRGGLGQIMEVGSAEEAPFAISSMFDRLENPPRGRDGGHDGAGGSMRLASGAALPPKGRTPIPAGDRLVLEMPGGGGYGAPAMRDPALVAADLRDELITPESARRDYGVALSPNGGASRPTRA